MIEEERDLTIGQALDLAYELFTAERYPEAVGLLRGVLKHEPENFEALNRLGAVLTNQKKLHEALYCFWRALKINRRSPLALSNYGMVLGELGHHEESAAALNKAVYLDPHNGITWNNIGNTLERIGRYQEALTALDKALAINPKDAMSHCNRGVVLQRLNRRHEAIESFEMCLSLDANYADAYYNRGCALLALGKFEQGWSDYEWRLKTAETAHYYAGPFEQPQWTGTEPLEGKTILVYAEQGIGDAIQFMRYIDMLLDCGAHLLMVVHKHMVSLFEPQERLTVLPGGHVFPPFDYWSPLLSLPKCFGTKLDNIPPPWFPHSVKTCSKCDYWYDLIAPALKPGRKPRVGVCWAGNWQHKNDRHRSIPLEQFARGIFSIPNVDFFSLQQVRPNERELFEHLNHHIVDLEPELHDFNDTAHAINRLDLVISVDTSVAHLAATLCAKTWILLPEFGTDWRWLLGRETSPWYPAARLFRQPKIGDWNSVLQRVKKELKVMKISNVEQTARYSEFAARV